MAKDCTGTNAAGTNPKPRRVVDGLKLEKLMVQNGMTEAGLAEAANVSTQTIRNYVGSPHVKPSTGQSKSFSRVCHALNVPTSDVLLELSDAFQDQQRIKRVQERFVGDAKGVRSIEGFWHASSLDVEIPNFVTYKSPMPWSSDVEIRQTGATFQAYGIDKDKDSVIADGVLMESGCWLRFNYFIDNDRLREYGVAMAEYRGDGKTIEGLFVGRDSGHSSIGLVVAKFTLVRQAVEAGGR